MLRVLTLSTLFPDAARPNFGVFVERQTLGLAAHPDVELSIDTTTRVVDVAGGESDMAVRFSAGPWPGVGCCGD